MCKNGLLWSNTISTNRTKLILTKLKQNEFTNDNFTDARLVGDNDSRQNITDRRIVKPNHVWWKPARASNRTLKEQRNENGLWKSTDSRSIFLLLLLSLLKKSSCICLCVCEHIGFFQNWTTSYGVVVDGNKREISRWRRNIYTYTLIHYMAWHTAPQNKTHTKRIAICCFIRRILYSTYFMKLHIASSSAYTQWNSSVNRC